MNLLEEAQMRKYDIILNEIKINDNDNVLEIGCGWGAFAIRAAKKYNCNWTALTISNMQYKIARIKSDEEQLSGRVNVQLRDYRYCLFDYLTSKYLKKKKKYISKSFCIVNKNLNL